MKSFLYIMSALAVMGLAFWAYNENYKTQAALSEVEKLQRKIGNLLETRAVLRAEWAYLNRPARLRDLASINFESLGLVPLRPEQFGLVTQMAYPPDPMDSLEGIEDVVGVIAAGVVPNSLLKPVPGAVPTADEDTP